jgi:hypothetical protein
VTKHLVVPVKRLWMRRELCIHCGEVGKPGDLFDKQGCSYKETPHQASRCTGKSCDCPCNFCTKFPFGDE